MSRHTHNNNTPMRQAWKQSGLKQCEIAAQAGCSPSAVCQFVNGSLRSGPVYDAIYNVFSPPSVVPASPEAAREELASMLSAARQQLAATESEIDSALATSTSSFALSTRLVMARSDRRMARAEVVRLESVADRYPAL